jgi:hypothetical protein
MDLKFFRINNVVKILVRILKLPFVASSISDRGVVEFDICNLFSISKRLVCDFSAVLISCIKVVNSVVVSVTGTRVELESIL